VLTIDEENWGPRPSRLLKCWQEVPWYKKFVIEKWKSFEVTGWGGSVLKEKLKLIKGALKEWHLTHTHREIETNKGCFEGMAFDSYS